MAWPEGANLLCDLLDILKKEIPQARKRRVYMKILDCFEAMDCDTAYEARGIDKVMDQILEGKMGDDL